tara:strand:- start:573 stop:773 length:201 start_codon:yes stop_codon:yes gene_type:complete
MSANKVCIVKLIDYITALDGINPITAEIDKEIVQRMHDKLKKVCKDNKITVKLPVTENKRKQYERL